jgi:hypothetical protein
MWLPVFIGKKYSYSYEQETGDYFLHYNEYKSNNFLHGKDAKIFSREIDRIDNLPEGENKPGLLMENAISVYL